MLEPSSPSSAATASSTHSSEEILEDRFKVFRVDVLLLSSATSEASPELVKDVLILEARVGVVVSRPSLVVDLAFAFVGEDFVGADWHYGYLLISANLSLALGFGFLSGWSS